MNKNPCCEKCKTISIKKDRPLTAGGGYPVVGCSNPSCECHAVVKEDQSNEWREEIRTGAGWTQDGVAMLKKIDEIVASEKQKSYEEGYKAAITNNKQ